MDEKPTLRMEEITQLSVINDDDTPSKQRVVAITVEASWWSQANNVAKQMIWNGLIATAETKWAAEDEQKRADNAQAEAESQAAAVAETDQERSMQA